MTESAVTVIVRRRVKAGCDAEYEAWLARLLADAAPFPGYLGATVQRPGPSGPRTYVSVFRFDSVDHLRAFEASELRARAMREVAPLVEGDAAWDELSGLEAWFEAPPGTMVPQPSRPRMALLMILVVYALVLVIGSLIARVAADVPAPVRLLATIAIEVSLLTWVIMPPLTRRLAWWIYPTTRAAS